jgi:hypothetical protein
MSTAPGKTLRAATQYRKLPAGGHQSSLGTANRSPSRAMSATPPFPLIAEIEDPLEGPHGLFCLTDHEQRKEEATCAAVERSYVVHLLDVRVDSEAARPKEGS